MNHIRKICVVTGARSEYGLLRRLIDAIDSSNVCPYSLLSQVLTSPEFGLTVKEIIDDGFHISCTIETPLVLIPRWYQSLLVLSPFIRGRLRFKPDLMLILGDRFAFFPPQQ